MLRAIGLSTEAALSSLRFGLGRFTTEEEVDWAAGRIVEAVKRLRALAHRIIGPVHRGVETMPARPCYNSEVFPVQTSREFLCLS